MAQLWTKVDQHKDYLQREVRGCQFTAKSFTKVYRKVIFANFLGVFSDLLFLASFLTVTMTVYRFLPMLRRILNVEGIHWKKKTVHKTVIHVFRDAAALLASLFVVLLVRRAGSMLIQISESDRSAKEIRKVVWRNVSETVADLIRFCSFLTMWHLYKYIVATAVYGVFTPVEMINQMMALFLRSVRWRKLRFYLSLLLWFALAAFPFVLVYYISPHTYSIGPLSTHNSAMMASIASYLGVLALLMFLSIRVAGQSAKYRSIPKDIRVMRFSWPNLFVVFSIFVETIQLSSFALSQLLPPNGVDSAIDSVDSLNRIRELSRVFTLGFQRISFESMYWITTAMVFIWYIAISAPVVTEHLLEWVPVGRTSRSHVWKSLVALLGTTLHIPILVNLMQPLSCIYTGPYAQLKNDNSILCWQAYYDGPSQALSTVSQPVMAVIALILLAFYLLTSQIVSSVNGFTPIQTDESLDVRFPLLYILTVSSTKAFLSVCFAIFAADPTVFLWIILFSSLALCVYTCLFPSLHGSRVCSITWVAGLRVVSFLVIFWSSLVALIGTYQYELTTESQYHQLIFDLGSPGWAVLAFGFIIFYVFAYNREKKLAMKNEAELIQVLGSHLTHLEEKLCTNGLLLPQWNGPNNGSQKKWRKELKSASRPITFARLMLQLENSILTEACTAAWLANRTTWRDTLQQIYEIHWPMLLTNSQQFFQNISILPPARYGGFPTALLNQFQFEQATVDNIVQNRNLSCLVNQVIVESMAVLKSTGLAEIHVRESTCELKSPEQPLPVEATRSMTVSPRMVEMQTVALPPVYISMPVLSSNQTLVIFQPILLPVAPTVYYELHPENLQRRYVDQLLSGQLSSLPEDVAFASSPEGQWVLQDVINGLRERAFGKFSHSTGYKYGKYLPRDYIPDQAVLSRFGIACSTDANFADELDIEAGKQNLLTVTLNGQNVRVAITSSLPFDALKLNLFENQFNSPAAAGMHDGMVDVLPVGNVPSSPPPDIELAAMSTMTRQTSELLSCISVEEKPSLCLRDAQDTYEPTGDSSTEQALEPPLDVLRNNGTEPPATVHALSETSRLEPNHERTETLNQAESTPRPDILLIAYERPVEHSESPATQA
eukprot:GILK01012655.1.p1 GENE.GILK01012655.1~~GILK01012655.1.p1  ORF type:complete len:1180 (+),score=243.63 GILK01012655.1:190-3540(+)